MNPDNRLKSPYGQAKSPSPRRTAETSGTSRTHLYLDDETLQRMIETFGPLEYSQFAATIASPYAALGEQSDVWNNDLEWPPPQESRRKSRSPRTEPAASSGGAYVLPQVHTEAAEGTPSRAEERRESLMEWFDRSVEKELKKRRASISPTNVAVDPALAPAKAKHTLSLSKGTTERMAETSASGVEISARLETDFTTELTDAVEKLAKAEAMCTYAEALQAAEAAAENAPPELVEQAAAAGAKRIQAEISHVKETVPGVRPIEVVGYVGITKPYYPKKSV